MLTLIMPASAQSLEKKDGNFGDWAVYCLKDVNPSGSRECSVVTGGHAGDDITVWAKVGFELAPQSILQMTVRIPFITNIGDGISIGFDGHQFGLVFLDTCTLISCQSTINVDPKMLRLLGSSSRLTIEYNYAKDATKILVFKLAGIKPGLALLQQLAVDPAPAIAGTFDDKTSTMASILRYTLERRELPSADSINATTAIWKTPYKKCSGVPETVEVTLSKELQIVNDRRLDEWLDQSRRCTDAAFVWVRSETRKGESFDPGDLGISTVLEAARKKFPAAEVPDDDKDMVPTSQWMSNAWAAVRTKTANKSETVNSSMAMSRDHEWRISKLAGVSVYNDANESLGLINDVIMDRSGKLVNVIISVGGFLGVGEKLITVAFDKLKWLDEPVVYAGAGRPGPDIGPRVGPTTGSATTGGGPMSATTRMRNPWYPDHAVYNVTKNELKAMPEFKY
jgi:invasion protein IalB/sporulation protein YlmC with PRC-barrel domain